MQFDLQAARRHLHLLTGEADPVVSWQTFDDTKRDPTLARACHGHLRRILPRLKSAQRAGCGVFTSVNLTDRHGRRTENMVAARATFLDLDGTPLPPSWPITPDIITHTSAVGGVEKFQCWWLLRPTDDWDRWRKTQRAMALRYGGDTKCCVVTQVGRVAGFWHQKDRANPHQVRIVHDGGDADLRISLDRLIDAFGFDLSKIDLPAAQRQKVDRPPPMHGWDNPLDIAAARIHVSDERNWHRTSDGAFSIYRMACALRDLGVSEDIAADLIEEYVPALPPAAEHDPRYVERKVANAFAYAQADAGTRSPEADRHALLAALRKEAGHE